MTLSVVCNAERHGWMSDLQAVFSLCCSGTFYQQGQANPFIYNAEVAQIGFLKSRVARFMIG